MYVCVCPVACGMWNYVIVYVVLFFILIGMYLCVPALISDPVPCQMEVCFVTQLEPTRLRKKSDQVHTTTL